MTQAVELAIAERNERGGICGAMLAAEIADDAGDAGKGMGIARAFCEDPRVAGVVGHYNSDVTLAASPIYARDGLAMITPIASKPEITERGLSGIFRFTNRDDRTGAAIAGHLYRVGGKRRAVILETPTTYGRSMAEEFARSFLGLGGTIVLRQAVQEGQRDFSPLVRQLPESFDVLFYGGSFEGAFILRALRKAGLDQLFASGDGCWDRWNFIEVASDVASLGEGVVVLAATPEPGRVAGSLEFSRRYEQVHGPIGNYAVNSYDSARVLLAAIERAAESHGRPPNRQEIVATMRASPFQGIAYHRPIEWDDKGDNVAATTALYVVKDRQFRQIAEIA